MRGEVYSHSGARGHAKLLLYLRGMPVFSHLVGLKALVYLAKKGGHTCPPSCAACPRLGINHNAFRAYEAPFQKGEKGQDGASGVAARVGHKARFRYLLPVDLRQAINRLFEILGAAVGLVPLLVHILVPYPEIR